MNGLCYLNVWIINNNGQNLMGISWDFSFKCGPWDYRNREDLPGLVIRKRMERSTIFQRKITIFNG